MIYGSIVPFRSLPLFPTFQSTPMPLIQMNVRQMLTLVGMVYDFLSICGFLVNKYFWLPNKIPSYRPNQYQTRIVRLQVSSNLDVIFMEYWKMLRFSDLVSFSILHVLAMDQLDLMHGTILRCTSLHRFHLTLTTFSQFIGQG